MNPFGEKKSVLDDAGDADRANKGSKQGLTPLSIVKVVLLGLKFRNASDITLSLHKNVKYG